MAFMEGQKRKQIYGVLLPLWKQMWKLDRTSVFEMYKAVPMTVIKNAVSL
jgi:hypothetical protein